MVSDCLYILSHLGKMKPKYLIYLNFICIIECCSHRIIVYLCTFQTGYLVDFETALL